MFQFLLTHQDQHPDCQNPSVGDAALVNPSLITFAVGVYQLDRSESRSLVLVAQIAAAFSFEDLALEETVGKNTLLKPPY